MATSKGFRMASIKINSLLKHVHIDELRVILGKHPLDILAINESKIDESISDNEIKVPGYVLYGGPVLPTGKTYIKSIFYI